MRWIIVALGVGVGVAEMLKPNCITDFRGIYGSSNTAAVPEGACELSDNCVIRSKGTEEARRGYKASASAGAPLNAIAFKESQVVAMTYDTPSATGTLRAYNPASDSWSTLAMNPGGLTQDRPGLSGAHTHFVSVNKALYYQSKYGLAKVEALSGGVSMAALHPVMLTATLQTPGGSFYPVSTSKTGFAYAGMDAGGNGSLWFGNNIEAIYRFTICRFGANRELIESAPSDRVIVLNNIGAPRTPVVFFPNSWMTAPDAFLRMYRTKTGTPGTDLADELYLIQEVKPGGSADSTGFLSPTFTPSGAPGTLGWSEDNTQDGALYVPLYTNAISGGGIASANTPAPLSADAAWFKNRLHLLNTSDVQSIAIKIIGTGAGGILDGDAITIAGHVFRFSSAATTGGSTYAGPLTDVSLFTAGTVAQNIENTARGLVNVVNATFRAIGSPLQGMIGARYVSVAAVDAGQVLLQSIVPGAAAFTVQTSSSAGWDRDYTLGTNSDPNAQVAGWMWSNFGQPEGVPTANNNPIGDQTAAGYRLIALKETLFAFKADGLWKITDDGSAVGPQLQLVDPTIRLVAPETAVALDNFILALADQGVILITETGAVLNISHLQIERELFKLMAYVGAARLAETAFAVAYQPEHTYILALPESPNATSATVQYVYNLQTQAWTRWTLPNVTSGAVHPDTGQLYWGRSDGTLWIERKSMDSSDYQDPGFTIASPTATQTKTLVFSGDLRTGATPLAVGDIVQQWQATNALSKQVVSVSYNSSANQTTVTLDSVPRYAWNQIVPLTIVKAVFCTTKLLPMHAGEPLTDKNWEHCYLSFRYCDLNFLTVGWESDKYRISSSVNPAQERVTNSDGSTNAPLTLETWGTGTFGSHIWGRQTKDVVLKCTMPAEFDHSSQLTLTLGFPCALSRFELNAIDVKISGATDRVVR